MNQRQLLFPVVLPLMGIPLEAYEYEVNGKPAIEWILERYQVTVDKDNWISPPERLGEGARRPALYRRSPLGAIGAAAWRGARGVELLEGGWFNGLLMSPDAPSTNESEVRRVEAADRGG